MASLLSIGGLLLVAAITPGPNNLVVLRIAARKGWHGALPAIAGIVAGGLALLVLVTTGAGNSFSTWPWLRVAIKTGGALYLAWLGARMVAAADRNEGLMPLPGGFPGMFGFQFLNPKGWIMVLTVVAALPTTGTAGTLLTLAPLFACIPTFCLLLWARLGGVLARHLAVPTVRRWIDRGLGALLIFAALLLLP